MTPVQVPVEATTAALAAASIKESGKQHKSALEETFTIPSPNHAVVGAWADAVKNYKGPPISDRAKACSVHESTEKLDALFRTCELGRGAPLTPSCRPGGEPRRRGQPGARRELAHDQRVPCCMWFAPHAADLTPAVL